MKKPKHISDKPVYKDYIKGGKVEITEKYELVDNGEYTDAISYIEQEYPETAKSFRKFNMNNGLHSVRSKWITVHLISQWVQH